jgi:hypothetical protein
MRLPTALAVIALLVLTTTVAAEEPPRRLALLVGCSDYPFLLERHGEEAYRANIVLHGPENDVHLMRETLVNRLGVPEKHVTTLAGWPDDEAKRPTRANILAHLDRLAREARNGDRVILLMAGHGSQQHDDSGDELDGLDEIFLPADVTDWDRKAGKVTNSISDDELGKRLKAIRNTGATVWVILDCCHSGTGTRGVGNPEVRKRRLDPAFLGVPEGAVQRGAGGSRRDRREEMLEPDAGDIVAFYGAPSHRTAPEMPLPRGSDSARPHGLLTYAIAQQLTRLGGRVTFEELHAQIVSAYQAIPYHGVLPQVDGNLALRVVPGEGDDGGAGPLMLLKEEEGELSVRNGGSLQGLTEGAVLEAYEPGRLGDAKASLGFVIVTESDLTSASCKRLKRKGRELRPLEGTLVPVRLVERPFGDQRLRIAVLDETGKALGPGDLPGDLRDALADQGSRFPLVPRLEKADWIVEDRGEKLRLRPARTGDGDSRPFVLDRGELVDALMRVFRVENLKRLAAGNLLPAVEDGPEVLVRRSGPEGTRDVRNGDVQRPGDRIRLEIRNESGADYDLWVFFADASFGLHVVFPNRKHPSPRLTHQDTGVIPLGPFPVTDDPVGTEHLLVLSIPREEGDPPVWLGWLAQEKLERAVRTRGAEGGGPLGDLLEDLAFGTRMRGWGVSYDMEASLSLLTWRTAWDRPRPPEDFVGAAATVIGERTDLAPEPTVAGTFEPASDETRTRGAGVKTAAAESVVVVRTRLGHAAGLLLPGGRVLTSAAVVRAGAEIDDAGRAFVRVRFGQLDEGGIPRLSGEPIRAIVVRRDDRRDLALLALREDAEEGKPIPFAETDPEKNATVVRLGHPSSGALWTAAEDRVAGGGRGPAVAATSLLGGLGVPEDRLEAGRAALERRPGFDALLLAGPIGPAEAGSVVLDAEGRLVGLIPGYPVRKGPAPCVSIREIRAFLEEDAPTAGPTVPDAWALGPNVSLARTGAGAPDVLLAGARRPRQVLVDLDGNARPDERELDRIVRERAFDAEIAFRFEADRSLVFYDRDDDGRFDLILVDFEGDMTADAGWRLEGDRWRYDPELQEPWLTTSHLPLLGKRRNLWDAACRKLRWLTGEK